MTDLKRDVQDDHGVKKKPTRETMPPQPEPDRTAGTDRDFDRSGESKNQGHGHPREKRGHPGD